MHAVCPAGQSYAGISARRATKLSFYLGIVEMALRLSRLLGENVFLFANDSHIFAALFSSTLPTPA
jgi:hypothetical protein